MSTEGGQAGAPLVPYTDLWRSWFNSTVDDVLSVGGAVRLDATWSQVDWR